MEAIFENSIDAKASEFGNSIDAKASDDNMARWLEQRLGPHHATTRLHKEIALEAAMKRPRFRERMRLGRLIDAMVPGALRLSGVLGRGQANAAKFGVVRNQVNLTRLPPAFDGFTILHLTDFHADLSEGAMRALPNAIGGLQYDICVLTGDFRGRIIGPHQTAVALTHHAISGIRRPIYGVLGNHDSAEMVKDLETLGVHMLMNEAEAIARGSDKLWIVGVDDPHYYRVDDLPLALVSVPAGAPTILLSHSTDGYRRAGEAGIDLMLSGHTHGGQICLPGGIPVVTSSREPRHMASGPWAHREMVGYTSKGVGTSVIDARFNCAPEIVLHTLRSR